MSTLALRWLLCFPFPVCLTLLASFHTSWAQPNVDQFVDFSAPGLPGRLFIPDQAATSDRPVIVFFHGSAEIGSNNTSQVNGNINNLLAAAQDRGAFIYAPQAIDFGWTGSNRTNLVMAKVNQILASQNADPQRVFLTGLSMGGEGAWTMGARYPHRFAANVPIAGLGPASDVNRGNLVGLPSWVFHARNDESVPNFVSRDLVNDILAAADEPTLTFPSDNDPNDFQFASQVIELNYTEYATGGHGIWPQVYDSGAMYDWLFSQSLSMTGDFNSDERLDVLDLNILVNMIVADTDPEYFDLNGDSSVDIRDQDEWLSIAGSANLSGGTPYLSGDANLDGSVDGIDFLAWNDNKFETDSAWSLGDFDASGEVDGRDFLIWNDNKFEAAALISAVPEPVSMSVCLVILLALRLRSFRMTEQR